MQDRRNLGNLDIATALIGLEISILADTKLLLDPTTLHAEKTLFLTYKTINTIFWL